MTEDSSEEITEKQIIQAIGGMDIAQDMKDILAFCCAPRTVGEVALHCNLGYNAVMQKLSILRSVAYLVREPNRGKFKVFRTNVRRLVGQDGNF